MQHEAGVEASSIAPANAPVAAPGPLPVVLVTDIRFWENTFGSHMRMQGLARVLSALGPLKVFFLGSFHAADLKAIKALNLPDAEFVSYKTWSGLKRRIKPVVGADPFFKGKSVDDFSSALSAYLGKTPARAVVLEYIRLAYLHDACPPGTQTILDMHDVMSERMVALARAGMTASIQIDARAERRILQAFDCVLTISRYDDDHLKTAMGMNNALYLPYSIPTVAQAPRAGGGRRLFFLGANSAPNVVGLRWFVDQVMPSLAGLGFTLDVVGTVCSSFEGRSDRAVQWHGQRDDLERFLAVADIAVNPVFVGGGLKIKCLDALANGLPVVTTEEGAAGLDHGVGAGIFVARGRQEFLSHILHLANAPQERQIIGVLARRFVEQEFSDAAALRSLTAHFGAAQSEPPGVGVEGRVP
ncbi:MAG: glycosyltransferase family 4 protein [Pararhodobacter sp.]